MEGVIVCECLHNSVVFMTAFKQIKNAKFRLTIAYILNPAI